MRPLFAASIVFVCACTATQAPVPVPQTSPAITAEDLRRRLYLIADDSMMGRESGSLGNYKTAEYVAAEFRRLGLEPAGDNGTWFQVVPFWSAAVDPKSHIDAGGISLDVFRDFVPVSRIAPPRRLLNVQAIYAGPANDSSKWISAEQADGKVLVFDLPAGASMRGVSLGSGRWNSARAAAIGVLDAIGPEIIARLR